jgi:SAM-dependent MidA family methyltransferase
LLATRAPKLTNRVQWLDALPRDFRGVIIANEVLDALPAHVVAWRGNDVSEHGVTGNAHDGFSWAERPASGALLDAALVISGATGLRDEESYVSEINLAAAALIGSLANSLARGAMLFVDYGFPRHEIYHPQRSSGTLMCHYRHRAHAYPFYLPGLQDITTHVDFTAVRDAGAANDLECLGFATQAQFLINCGITGVLSRVPASEPARYLPRAAEAQKLLSPSEMGELFKVIALGKSLNAGLSQSLLGFAAGDMRARLG